MNDPYLDLIQEQWDNIATVYNRYAVQYPIMLIDVQEAAIHAYPFEEFLMVLDPPSRQHLEAQYRRALASRQMVLFVRDTERKVFQSYTLSLEDET
ncbi:MAG: hypothetical protein H3C34_20440 [Caldilineaceae bacterium]|nr:hypothetical protein [Caldilineaceae bacterium]